MQLNNTSAPFVNADLLNSMLAVAVLFLFKTYGFVSVPRMFFSLVLVLSSAAPLSAIPMTANAATIMTATIATAVILVFMLSNPVLYEPREVVFVSRMSVNKPSAGDTSDTM